MTARQSSDDRRQPISEFFVAGGTLPLNTPSYVRRQADETLFGLALAGQFCYVLTTRQMGKSSLMIRTYRHLQSEGVQAAIIDLTSIGSSEVDIWYLDLLSDLVDQLELSIDVEAWWQAHASLGYVRRFINFLRQIVLTEITTQVVIFIDEIDFTLNLDFSDDFFAAIRSIYNARAKEPAFSRLTFVLLGVASPADLIKGRTRTPFNIGQQVILKEFSHADAAILQTGLEVACPGQGELVFERIYHWTNGHPYLTQKLCLAVVQIKDRRWTAEEVDQLVEQLFLSEEGRKENNFQFVRDRIEHSSQRQALLTLYRQVYEGEIIREDERSSSQNQLRLFGLVRSEGGVLLVRNEIYRQVFNQAWIQANLEENWFDMVANWLNLNIRGFFSGYRSAYLRYLTYRHRAFEVKLAPQGSYPFELDRVFVPLRVAFQTIDRISKAPGQSKGKEDYEIWELLTSKRMAKQNLVVVGPPGSGKTTLLQHITLTLAADQLDRRKLPPKLPILLFLREHAEAIKANPNLSLVSALQENLAGGEVQAPPSWFEVELEKGRCLVMLDGLDEVADIELREVIVRWVERQMVVYSQNRFILTARPLGYRNNPLRNAALLKIRPFTHDQIQQFIYRWYLANEVISSQREDAGVRRVAEEGTEKLLRLLQDKPVLSALAANPLLLTMIATIHRQRGSLPAWRADLYAEICDVFLGKREKRQGLAVDLTPAQRQRVLQPLAYQMMCRQVQEITQADALAIIREPLAQVNFSDSSESFLQMIANSSGLLLEPELGLYSFAHLTFQEYLAAVHIREQKLERALVQRIEESWWHETSRLYVAQADATPIIEACLRRAKSSVPALTLAIACLMEAREVQPDVRAKFERFLVEGLEDIDPKRRQIIAAALLDLRLSQMTRLKADKYIAKTLITHAEYQLFLDEHRARGQYYQPDHWLTDQYPAGQGNEAVVGVRSGDAVVFCDWLTRRVGGEWHYRLPFVGELPGDAHLQIEKIGYWIVSEAGVKCTLDEVSASTKANKILVERISLDLALARALDRGLAPDHSQDEDLVGMIRNNARSGQRHQVTAYIDALNCTPSQRNLIIELGQALAHDLDRDLRRISSLDLGQSMGGMISDQDAFYLDLARAFGLETTFIEVIRRVARIRDVAQLKRLIQARNHPEVPLLASRDLHQARALVQTINHLLNRDRTLTLDLSPGHGLELLDHPYVPALDRALALVLDRNPDQILEQAGNRAIGWGQVFGFLRWCVRLFTLTLAIEGQFQLTFPQQATSRLSSSRHKSQVPQAETRRLIETCLDLYADFAILEARVQRTLPPLEGIRLVKERMK